MRLLRSFAWAAGATLLLALVGGMTLSQGFLRRVDEINRASSTIMRGDLANRIQTTGTGDELDRTRPQSECHARSCAGVDGRAQAGFK